MADPTPEDVLIELVNSHWDTASRHAWKQYQERGRGAIVFRIDPSAEQERQPLRYLTFTDEEAAANGSFAMLHELVETYDPEEQVVIAAVLPDDRTVFDVFEQSPPPPEA